MTNTTLENAPELLSVNAQPDVLCITRTELANHSIEDSPETAGVFPFQYQDIDPKNFEFLNRSIVDTKEDIDSINAGAARNFPQILGYIIVKNSRGQILSYARKHSPNETRLLGSRSIGFGGHIESEDLVINHNGDKDYSATIYNSARRELQEEICLFPSDRLYTYSLESADRIIVDLRPNAKDATKLAVGEAHCGVLFEVLIDSNELVTSTKETQDLQWFFPHELFKDLDLYESWSQLLITDYLRSVE